MSHVESQRISERVHCLVELVNETVLVTEQSVRVREERINLDGSLEIADCDVVLFLQAEAVAGYTPSLHTASHSGNEPVKTTAERCRKSLWFCQN